MVTNGYAPISTRNSEVQSSACDAKLSKEDERRHRVDAIAEMMREQTMRDAEAAGAARRPEGLTQLVGAQEQDETSSSGKVYAAGLDVTAPEPLDPEHTLLNRDNVVVTPHIASATDKGRVRMYSGAIENARQVLAGERPVDCVNPHVYEVLEGRSS